MDELTQESAVALLKAIKAICCNNSIDRSADKIGAIISLCIANGIDSR